MDFISKLTFIAAGGAFGAVARHLLNISPLQHLFQRFPFPTFIINVSGSFLIGLFLILLTDRIEINDNLRYAVVVGFLGAFTTFSTFELEIWALIKDDHYSTALLYLILSVAAGFLALLAGIWTARTI